MVREHPDFVAAILEWRWIGLIARLLMVSAYVIGAANKLTDFPGAIAEQTHFGMHPPQLWAVLTITVEIVGSLLILTNRLVWLGAGMLGVFTGLAALKANAFWAMAGAERFAATNAFFEHLGLIGGFLLIAMLDLREDRQSAQSCSVCAGVTEARVSDKAKGGLST